MSPGRRMGRRAFLLAGAGAAAALAAAPPWTWPLPGSSAPAAERLAGLLDHQASAIAVGRAYLSAAPTRPELLVSQIARALPGGRRAIERASDDRLRRMLHRATLRDFARERTVVVDGWILSGTEAGLCALAAQPRRMG
jgi:hypothetical protein